MLLYRISKCTYIDDLSGTGARLYGGRWNNIGRAMVYTASSRSLAVLEVLVHLPPTLIPDNFCQITLDVPDDTEVLDMDALPRNWQDYPEPSSLKSLGDAFLKTNKHLLLKVPSAIVKEEFNYLINPLHPKARHIKIVDQKNFTFDERLIG
ncbi:RES family NAD+ phosphorylase [Mucilaginibacter aquatilis]|uniref:RES domain-containing protein n=1 Tax=Mucilaginibacter aquatilis TaxID=1517760 RepID=A0A6I4I824_9SPHI|nr:RES family NAD+ phosphorylase [Mucilaginibacter aquatilis]MVN89556.1 RES domain-containing protein [Mucilaginibacter aquatilis]